MEIIIKNNQRLIRISKRKVNKVLRKALQYLKDNGKLNSLLITRYPSLELSVLFVNDRKMRGLNLQYRGKDKTTDVLSFPQSAFSVKRGASSVEISMLDASRSTLLGDIVINLHQAKRQALQAFSVKCGAPSARLTTHNSRLIYEEVTRLLIHGLLHLLGYDHEKNKYQARKMREMERELLSALPLDSIK